jgi:hypothetical protein
MAKKKDAGPTPVDSIKHKDTRKNTPTEVRCDSLEVTDPWDAKGVMRQAIAEATMLAQANG